MNNVDYIVDNVCRAIMYANVGGTTITSAIQVMHGALCVAGVVIVPVSYDVVEVCEHCTCHYDV